MGGKGILAKDLIDRTHQPVGERRFLNIANPVDLRGDQIARFGDMLRGLGMAGVHVVQQGRRKKRGELHGREECCQQRPNRQHRRRRGGAILRGRIVGQG